MSVRNIIATWCADCLAEHVPLTPRPLGRNGGMVLLCPACDPGDPKPTKRKGKPTFRGYDVPAPRTVLGRTVDAFSRAANRIAPAPARTKYSGDTASPGFIVVRVLRMRAGFPIDRDEARRTLQNEPWFAELRHIGSDARFHIFERPDVDLAKRVRSAPSSNVMDELRREAEKKR